MYQELARSNFDAEKYSSMSPEEKRIIDEYATPVEEETEYIKEKTWREYTNDRGISIASVTAPYCWKGQATSSSRNAFGVKLYSVTVQGTWCQQYGKVVSAKVDNRWSNVHIIGWSSDGGNQSSYVNSDIKTKRGTMLANYKFYFGYKSVPVQTKNLCSRINGYINNLMTNDTSCSVY